MNNPNWKPCLCRDAEAKLCERIEELQFSIEMEGYGMPTAERWATLSKRQEIIDRYAVEHLGSIVIGD